MTPERFGRIRELYHEALACSAEERAGFVERACAGDHALRNDLVALLAANDAAGTFLDSPAIAVVAAGMVSMPPTVGPGTRIGPYDVRELLGRGGMGEVYRAHDRRLARDVALKLLPRHFSSDPGRVARLEREALLLAALNHPNIGSIYGIEELDGERVLVLELVEGTPLDVRLASGRLPLREAMQVGEQIVDALEAAHDRGIIHRDLKPANITIRPDGTVKVLDFGLGKALTPSAVSPQDAKVTDERTVFGTASYMSPEQARGATVDARADIWAFGCVLYEMVTGRRPFTGETSSDVIAAILDREPDWNALSSDIPPSIRRLLRRCLQKDVRVRLRHIADVRADLKDAASEEIGGGPARSANRWRYVAVALAGVMIAAAAVVIWMYLRQVAAPASPAVHLRTRLPDGVTVTRGPGIGSSVAISPDGRTLVIAGTDQRGQRLYRRPIDRLEATPIAETDDASGPFFSWDGNWIGFYADGRLKRVPTSGGAAVDIASVPGVPAGASWGPDDRIVFAYGAEGHLVLVDGRHGTAAPFAAIPKGYYPEFVGNDGKLLFELDGWVHLFDPRTGRVTQLTQGSAPHYADGRLLLNRGTTLLAAAFDLSHPDTLAPVVPVVDRVARDASPSMGMRHYAVSRSGALAYVPAPATYDAVIVRADGSEQVVRDGDRWAENPRFSPDGRLIAIAAATPNGDGTDLWLHDLLAGTATRLTFDGARAPVWTPDGAGVVYSHLGDRRGLYMVSADGRGRPVQLLALRALHWLVGWTPDRHTLAYGVMEGTPSSVMAMSGGDTRRVVGPGSVWGGRLSRDGKWLAYYSCDSGKFEVYVTPFPDGGPRWSIGDGTDPAWRPDGTEVYYRKGSLLYAARLDWTAGVRVRSRRVVVDPFVPPLYDDYDIHPDGRTLVLVRPSTGAEPREVTMIVNWFDELARGAHGSEP